MKCKHRLRRDIRYWVPTAPGLVPSGIEMTITRCNRCDSMLSLGASNDADERVGVEIRAAEIAALGIGTPHLWITRDEDHGWRDYANEDGGGDCRCSEAVRHDAHNWHAGHLARVIAETSGGGGG